MTIAVPFWLIARVLAVVFGVLFVILAFFPMSYAPTYGVVADPAVVFMTQRASPMFLLPMCVLWVAGGCPRDPLRDAVPLGTALMCVGIAVSGVYAWISGFATPTILIAAALECVMAAAVLLSFKN